MAAIVPQIGLSKLSSLRGREQLYHAAWGVVRWVSLALVLLAVTTFIDWRIDKVRETPQWVRVPLSLIQFAVLGFAGWHWLAKPWMRGPSIVKLARRVEERYPEFGHRLVTSIQLNKANADTRGMSPLLIENLTKESEDIARRHDFVALADSRRLKWAGSLVAVPLLLFAVMLLLYGPTLFGVLVKRQLFASAEIPRFHQLENLTPGLWPAGDEVTLEFAVAGGRIDESEIGRAWVKPENLPADNYELKFSRYLDDGRPVFAARVPHSSVNFRHRAWIGDGRTKQAYEVRFEPRPVITRTDAWVRLPKFLGNKPDGGPYETYQSQGDIAGLPNSMARVRVCAQKALSEATLILIARGTDGTSEVVKKEERMNLRDEEQTPEGAAQFPAELTFDLTPDLIAYRVEVKDVHGFANSTPPRRGILLAPDEAPMVRLLQERYAELGGNSSDEDVIDGLPIPLGGQIPVAYTSRSPQGVSKGVLRYRINEKGPWLAFPLTTVEETEKTGPFNPLTGGFQKTGYGEQVQFHPAKSSDRESTPDYLTGGGRFDFQTAQLTKVTDEGKTTKLEVGDHVEFYVEVFDRNPKLAKDGKPRPPGKSEVRMKEILSASDVLLRLDQTRQAEGKIRDIEQKQRSIFGVPVAPGKR
ncbi:hypothetical protein [Zavarzinella formosa]|uniref:hypothetical protein n=1 Tax=Zavarzinella formosa TaxID=360055 RepID=UPI0002E60FAC|nr:hypothetical protein [Zavarzinella formosa]